MPSSPRSTRSDHSPLDPIQWAVIVDNLLSLCGFEQLLRLRTASKAYRDLCDARLARHTIIKPVTADNGNVVMLFTTPVNSRISKQLKLPLLPFHGSQPSPSVERTLAFAHVVEVHYESRDWYRPSPEHLERIDKVATAIEKLHAHLATYLKSVKSLTVFGRWPSELPHTGERLFLHGKVPEAIQEDNVPSFLSLPRLQPFKNIAIFLKATSVPSFWPSKGNYASYPSSTQEVALIIDSSFFVPQVRARWGGGAVHHDLVTASSNWRAEQLNKLLDTAYLTRSPITLIINPVREGCSSCAVLKEKLIALLKARCPSLGSDDALATSGVNLDSTTAMCDVSWLNRQLSTPYLAPSFFLSLPEAPRSIAPPPLRELESAFKQQIEPFAVGGSIPVASDHALYVVNTDETILRLALPLDASSAARLHDAAHPSSFGRGPELVYDETYRTAREIRPASFSLSGDVLAQASVLHTIQTSLCTGPLYASVAKLNVYAESGLFKPHRDTPRGDNHIGTITMCLPSTFSGGELAVRHEGEEQVFDWSTTRDAVSWAFLYSDCEHEVLPVTSGMRVTLAYDVYVNTTAISVPPTPHTQISAELEKVLDNPDFLWNGGVLGFGLKHAYAKVPAGGFEGFQAMLKGSDAVWARALAAAGLSYEFVAVYRDQQSLWDKRAYKNRKYRTSYNFFEYDGGYVEDGDEYTRDVAPLIHWVTKPKLFMIENHYTSFGNEPSPSIMYVSVGIVVFVGPPGRRGSFDADTFDMWRDKMEDGCDFSRWIP